MERTPSSVLHDSVDPRAQSKQNAVRAKHLWALMMVRSRSLERKLLPRKCCVVLPHVLRGALTCCACSSFFHRFPTKLKSLLVRTQNAAMM